MSRRSKSHHDISVKIIRGSTLQTVNFQNSIKIKVGDCCEKKQIGGSFVISLLIKSDSVIESCKMEKWSTTIMLKRETV